MIFCFKNKTKEDITINIEPSTDEFLLHPDSIIKIHSTDLKKDSEFQFDHFSDGIVIWMPTGLSAKIFIDGEKIDSFYEDFDW